MKSEYVQDILKNLVDTIREQQKFKVEVLDNPNAVKTQEDVFFHEQLINQVNRCHLTLYEIFFSISAKERMKIIERSRNIRMERVFSRASSRFSIQLNSALLEQASKLPPPALVSPTSPTFKKPAQPAKQKRGK